jgi:hypothetical protein
VSLENTFVRRARVNIIYFESSFKNEFAYVLIFINQKMLKNCRYWREI